LRELGRTQTPENAHALLLELGYWDYTVNPYPVRLKLPTDAPAMALPDLPDESRVDLTHLPAFAIDDEDSKDPDDALSLDQDNRLWVHVADVAALVPPGSPADLEARARAAKLYLPQVNVPMLPPEATTRLALGLAELSPALSFGLAVSPEGKIGGVEVVPSWVRVTRLTYEEAETRLAEAPFRQLYQLAQTYQARREANGAVSIDLPEVKVRVVEDQVVIRPVPALKSRDLVRESMLMAGEAIARFALEQEIPLSFTTQEVSEPPADLPEGLAGMYARRRSMQRSQLSTVPAPHGGLGLDRYSQVTSPLRRYLDLVMHQQLRAYLRGRPLLGDQDILERVGAAESMAGSVRQAERLSYKHWTLVYLMQQPDWQGQGVIVEKQRTRDVVLIPELDLITYMHLREDLSLNTELSLAVREVNLPTLDAYFRVVG
jgi:exoribonuclease-2